MRAKFRNTCPECLETIHIGTRISNASGKWAHVDCDEPGEGYASDGDRADFFGFSSGGFYSNPRGTCEDAPCCGCCGWDSGGGDFY